MRKMTLPVALCTVILAAGCTKPAADNYASIAVNDVAVAVTSPNGCAAIKTSGWKAWLNTMPGPGATRTLHVVGEAAPTTLGWTFELKASALTKPLPPTQIFEFIATPPNGQAGQTVPPPQPVKAEIANALPAYKSVEILCGRTTIASIPVLTVS